MEIIEMTTTDWHNMNAIQSPIMHSIREMVLDPSCIVVIRSQDNSLQRLAWNEELGDFDFTLWSEPNIDAKRIFLSECAASEDVRTEIVALPDSVIRTLYNMGQKVLITTGSNPFVTDIERIQRAGGSYYTRFSMSGWTGSIS